jgi:hypothetical protein
MKPMPNRKKFQGLWDEIEYLYFKAGHWMYERGKPSRAKPFIRRLEPQVMDHLKLPACRWPGIIALREGVAWSGELSRRRSTSCL